MVLPSVLVRMQSVLIKARTLGKRCGHPHICSAWHMFYIYLHYFSLFFFPIHLNLNAFLCPVWAAACVCVGTLPWLWPTSRIRHSWHISTQTEVRLCAVVNNHTFRNNDITAWSLSLFINWVMNNHGHKLTSFSRPGANPPARFNSARSGIPDLGTSLMQHPPKKKQKIFLRKRKICRTLLYHYYIFLKKVLQ